MEQKQNDTDRIQTISTCQLIVHFYGYSSQKWLLSLSYLVLKNRKNEFAIDIIEQINRSISETDNKILFQEDFYKNEINNNSIELLMSLILLKEDSDFNTDDFNILKQYLLNKKENIYINLYQIERLFEPRLYYLSQLFIGKKIGIKEWQDLWTDLYSERKECRFPKYYNNSTLGYRSKFLIVLGVAAIEYLYDCNKTKAKEFIDIIWKAIKDLYLYEPKFNDEFIVAIVFRIILLSKFLKISYKKFIEFIKVNPEILTKVLINLDNNNFEMSIFKNDNQILSSVDLFINKIGNKKMISKIYLEQCKNLYKKLI